MTLVPLPPGTPGLEALGPKPLGFLSVHGGEVNFDLAAKLSGIFTAQISANDQAYMLEMVALTDQEDPITDDGSGNKLAIRYGVGVRIMFRVAVLKAGFNATYATIGAGLQLGLVSATYDVLQYGLNPVDALATLLNSFTPGNLTADSFQKINSELLDQLQKSIQSDPGSLTPQPITVRVSSGEGTLLNASRSVVYAIENIRERHSQSDAIRLLPKGLSREYVARAYDQIAGKIPFTDVPGPMAAARAKTWLGV